MKKIQKLDITDFREYLPGSPGIVKGPDIATQAIVHKLNEVIQAINNIRDEKSPTEIRGAGD